MQLLLFPILCPGRTMAAMVGNVSRARTAKRLREGTPAPKPGHGRVICCPRAQSYSIHAHVGLEGGDFTSTKIRSFLSTGVSIEP